MQGGLTHGGGDRKGHAHGKLWPAVSWDRGLNRRSVRLPKREALSTGLSPPLFETLL